MIDRDTASRLGITPQMIDDTLYDAFGQRQVSTIFTQLNQYHVVLEVEPRLPAQSGVAEEHLRPLGHRRRRCRSARSRTSSPSNAPLAINHQGQFPVVTLSFNLAPGVSLGDAVKAIREAEREIGFPASIQASFQGTAQAFQNSLANEPLLILAALVTVYIVLGVLYESYIHPHHDSLDAAFGRRRRDPGAAADRQRPERDRADRHHPADRHREEERHHDDRLRAGGGARTRASRREESIYQACLLRFRPIMMTTMAALLGGVPLALGTGTGSELRRPLGITIVGGLIVSQVLTLYTTPVVYLFFDRLARRLQRAARSEARVRASRCHAEVAHEPLLSIHPPAGGDVAADGGAGAGRRDRLPPAAGGAAAAGGVPDHPASQAGLPGASPETMASSVATPLERQFGRIAGVTEMTSSSQLGSTSITLQFDLNRNIDAAARDVQAAINAARGQLPAEPAEQSHATAR